MVFSLDSFLRRIRLRRDEMRFPPEKKSAAAAPEISAGASDAGSGEPTKPTAKRRKRHEKEAPFIKEKDFGKIVMECKNKTPGWFDETGDPMRMKDLYEHVLVFGGSGTGKTYSVLQPLWEECFRSTHLPDGPKRDQLKFGALVIEAKGDFRDKTWHLAQKYGRMDDCVYFGPTHEFVYDMFGDPTETPLQLANKLLAILKGFSGGKESADPFWDNASRKLFLNLIYLHSYVRKRLAAATTEEEKEKFAVPGLSFELLNLVLSDKGQPQNANEIRAASEQISKSWGVMREAMGQLRTLTMYLEAEMERISKVVDRFEAANDEAIEEYENDFALGVPVTPNITAPMDEPTPTPEEEQAWLEKMAARKEALDKRRSAIGGLKMLIGSPGRERASERFSAKCDRLRKALQGMDSATTDEQRGAASSEAISLSGDLAANMRRRLIALDEIGEGNSQFKGYALKFADMADQFVTTRDSILRMNSKIPKPKYGALKKMIAQYEEILKEKGAEAQLDPVWSYFDQEYLNIANDKTSGSVAMVATNLVSLFVHGEFKRIFAPNANFNFADAIDKGQIVYLDMPTALYGAAATVASLVMKIDFFRCTLSRRRLCKRPPGQEMTKELVNQDRPLVYFVDEFASIVTTGDETGEAGFLDKVREFGCACILGTQSIPMLLKKISENEVDAIMTNTAIKIFLRNTDPKTNKFASELFGTEVKVNATLNKGAGLDFSQQKSQTDRGYTTSYSKGARYDVGAFTKLQKGEAMVCLNPRFRKHQMQRIQFAGKAIVPLDDKNMFPLPEIQ